MSLQPLFSAAYSVFYTPVLDTVNPYVVGSNPTARARFPGLSRLFVLKPFLKSY